MALNALLVYPRFPDTYWGFRHSLKFIGKKASYPPLGLLTIAALFPSEFKPLLIDMNVRPSLTATYKKPISFLSPQCSCKKDLWIPC